MAESLDGTYRVFAKNWTEYDFGQRADGYSLHLSKEDAEEYAKEHTTDQFRPDYGVFAVIISQALFDLLLENRTSGGHGLERAFPSQLRPGDIIKR